MGSGPLDGIRVVELAGLGPVPFCGMFLADLGADVVLVERPGGGWHLLQTEDDLQNRGKRSVEVDLKDPAGAATVLDLVDRADVLLEGFRPGVAERLGVGPDVCLERRPSLVYGSMTGWGQDGPLAQQAGHDLDYIAIAGVLGTMGDPDGPPPVPLNLIGDFGGGGMYLAAGVLAALVSRAATGRGQVVDAAMVDGAAHLSTIFHGLLAAGQWRAERGVNELDGAAPFYRCYQASDGSWLAVGPGEPHFFAVLMDLLGHSELTSKQRDRAAWPELTARIAEVFATRTRDEWLAVFEGTDACVAPVLSLTEAPQHPHNVARDTFVEHGGVVQPAPAPRFSGTPARIDGPRPTRGQHTAEVFAEWGVPSPGPASS